MRMREEEERQAGSSRQQQAAAGNSSINLDIIHWGRGDLFPRSCLPHRRIDF